MYMQYLRVPHTECMYSGACSAFMMRSCTYSHDTVSRIPRGYNFFTIRVNSLYGANSMIYWREFHDIGANSMILARIP